MWEHAALFFIWFIFVPITIMIISNNSTKIGFYHISRLSERIPVLNTILSTDADKVKPRDKLEPFFDKYVEMATCNCKLSLPFIFAFYSIVITSSSTRKLDLTDTILLSFSLTIIVLILMRFLSNPTERFFKPILMTLITHPIPEEKQRLEKKVIKDHEERVISFFFSFFAAAIIVSLILLSYDMLSDSTSTISALTSPTIQPNTGSLFLQIIPIYVLVLLILTFLGEIVLFFLKPLRQFPVTKGEWYNQPDPPANQNNSQDTNAGNDPIYG